jgi:hypothetical protein
MPWFGEETEMATAWSGKLCVLSTADGRYHVGFTRPTNSADPQGITVYEVTGPYPPTFPEFQSVNDLEAWMKQLQNQGFRFARMPAVPPSSLPGGPVIDPNKE